jgi:STE24 endopeptidase
MPRVLIFLLLASTMNLPWPASQVGSSALGSALATLGVVLVPVSISLLLALRVMRASTESGIQQRLATRLYAGWRNSVFYVNVVVCLIAIFVFGWGQLARSCGTNPLTHRLYPYAELLVPLPYFVIIGLNWVMYWLAERTLVRQRHATSTFPTLVGFWIQQARQFLLMVMLPIFLTVSHQSVTRLLPQTASQAWFQFTLALAPIVFLIFFPLLLRLLLQWKPMPDGPRRTRFETTLKRMKIRYANVLVMPTQGLMANAFVIGFVPWARYFVFTDAILDAMDDREIDAVLGHEMGHVRHWHLPIYLVILTLSSVAVSGSLAMIAVMLRTHGPEWLLPWLNTTMLSLALLVVMGLYLFVVFGWLSRACERQADLFGSLAVSCLDPHCDSHNSTTQLSEASLCPTGLRSMALALERVGLLNGLDSSNSANTLRKQLWSWLRAWQHGPLNSRIAYLYRVIQKPVLAVQHHRKVRRMLTALVFVLLLIAALGLLMSEEDFELLFNALGE